MRIASFAYGLISYAIFFCTFVYAAGFQSNLVVPKSIDNGPFTPLGQSIVINLILLTLFGLQHTIMARPGFKAWWTTIIPAQIERATYVLISSLLIILLFWQWRPMPAAIWYFPNGGAYWLLMGGLFAGFGLVLVSSFLIDHFDLFGLRQVYLHLRGVEYTPKKFSTPFLYKYIRHPLYVGWFLSFWCTPSMTQGHLLFAAVWTAYILIAIPFEERDLVKFLGEPYNRYRAGTPMFLPWRIKKSPAASEPSTEPGQTNV